MKTTKSSRMMTIVLCLIIAVSMITVTSPVANASVAPGSDAAAPEVRIDFNNTELRLFVGETETLELITNQQEIATHVLDIHCESSDPDVVKIEKKEKSGTDKTILHLKALKAGFAKITAECEGKTAECMVYVNEEETGPVFKNGQITVYTPYEFYEAVEGNKKKTVIIGKDMKIDHTSVGNNTTVIATGRKITCNNGAIRIPGTKAKYKSFNNVKIKGGTWKSNFDLSLFQFVHGQNLTMENMNITCGITGHAIELIACKNVLIKNCKVKGVGKAKKDCVEEQIQIDLATPRTAPTVANKLRKGQTCQNITIDKCTVTGARAVCSNYASVEKKYRSKFHKNITVKNCTLTGQKSEALALFNALNVTVKNNKIKTKAPLSRGPYSVGCHIHMFGTVKGVPGSKRKVTITGNTVHGGREAILIYSHSSSKYGKATVRKNKAYCKNGKGSAIKVDGVSSKSVGSNKTAKW